MKINEPIGNAEWAPFFVRMALGLYLMISGLWGMDNSLQFTRELGSHPGIPNNLITAFGILAPYGFVVVGGLVMAGFWTTLMGFLAILLIAPYLYTSGLFHQGTQALTNRSTIKELMLVAGGISLLFSGGGALSVDKFRKA